MSRYTSPFPAPHASIPRERVRPRQDLAEFFEGNGSGDEGGLIEVTLDAEDWRELYDSGIDYHEAARLVFEDLADADDAEVDAALSEMAAGMSPEETAEFFGKIARAAKRVAKKVKRVALPALRVAAPMALKIAAPAVGTALGGPLGGVVGGLLGKTASGVVSSALGGAGRRSVRAMSRIAQRTVVPGGISSPVTSQLLQLLRSPSVQRTLLRSLSGESMLRAPSGESMSAPAVLIGLHGAIVESLAEMRDHGIDIDYSTEGYAPADFDSAQSAFETLVGFVEETEG